MALDLSFAKLQLTKNHELLDCSFDRNENDRCQASFVMPWDDVFSLNGITPGEKPPTALANLPFDDMRVETCSIGREEAGVAKVNMSLVRAESATKPYHYTVNIDYPEVQRPLVSHPLLTKKEKSMLEFRYWLNTEERLRVLEGSDGKPKFMYYAIGDDGEVPDELTEMEDETAVSFAKAYTAGITHYNSYLPVIELTSLYLKLPGVDIDPVTHKISGTMEGADKLGRYDDPPFSIEGFTEHLWFKSMDKVSQNGNGTWSRVETWTCTNDKRWTFLYDDNASTAVVDEE